MIYYSKNELINKVKTRKKNIQRYPMIKKEFQLSFKEMIFMIFHNKDFLRKKYLKIAKEYDEKMILERTAKTEKFRVWTMWWQGIEDMPEIIKACHISLIKNSPYEVVLITKYNVKEYIEMPNEITKKLQEGIISITHFSDILRCCLLEKYGGIWVDASIYVMKKIEPIDEFSLYTMKNDEKDISPRIFLMGSGNIHHPLFQIAKNDLLNYWMEYNNVLDYFMLDYFMKAILEIHAEIREDFKLIPINNKQKFRLLLLLSNKFDINIWNEIKEENTFQKISQKKDFLNKNGRSITFGKFILNGEQIERSD